MDLKAFDTRSAANEGRRCPILSAAREETDVVLLLAGADSDRFRQADQESTDRRFARGRDGLAPITSAELYEENLDKLVRCTLGWEGLTEDGQPLPCTPEHARRLYDMAPVVREQAWAFIMDRAHFSRPSKPD